MTANEPQQPAMVASVSHMGNVGQRLCRYLETALRDAARAGQIERQDFQVMARELYRCIIGALVEVKIENNLEVIHQLKPAIWRVIGANQKGSR